MTLYLHGGPGLNSAVERAWFGERAPILWWDQPRFAAETPAAFLSTLEAAAAQLGRLRRARGGPVNVVAWSFGCLLAAELAHRSPADIGELTLLTPTLSLEQAFLRLATKLVAEGQGTDELPFALKAFGASHCHESFLVLAMALLGTPDLLKRYWAPGSEALCTRHLAEVARTDWLDLPTFIAVSRDLFDRPPPERALTSIGALRILAGRHDLYFDPDSDLDAWRTRFPGAAIQVVDAGHMLPFERPIAEWLPT